MTNSHAIHNYILSDVNNKKSIYSKVAVVINLYYYNDIDGYYRYISNIPDGIDIYIFSSDEKILKKILNDTNKKNITFSLKDNRGRDLSALLVAFGTKALEYDMVCFVHDKAKKYIHMENDINIWIDNLWGNMLASNGYIYNILELMEKNNLGILVPPEPIGEYSDTWYRDAWYGNESNTINLAGKLGIDLQPEAGDRLSLGSVCWCRTNALKKIFEYKWKYEDFPEEPMANDGTISHAIERLFGYAALDAGYDMGVVMSQPYAAWLLEVSQNKLKSTYEWIWNNLGVKNTYELDNLSEENKNVNIFFGQHPKIYVYGAGNYAQSNIKRLEYFEKKPDGFVVSDGYKRQEILMGYKVYEVSQIISDEEAGIIIAANFGLQMQI